MGHSCSNEEMARRAIDSVSGKWAPYVVLALADEPKTFSDLRKRLDGVSNKVLSSTNSSLETSGIVSKRDSGAGRYRLTVAGERMAQILSDMFEWERLYGSESSPTEILVIEDDDSQAEMYSRYLEHFDVSLTSTVSEFYEEFDAATDVVVLDRMLDGKDGAPVVQQISDIESDTGVVVATGVLPEPEILEWDIQDYLVKPVSQTQLIGSIAVALQSTSRSKTRKAVASKRRLFEVVQTYGRESGLESSDVYRKFSDSVEDA